MRGMAILCQGSYILYNNRTFNYKMLETFNQLLFYTQTVCYTVCRMFSTPDQLWCLVQIKGFRFDFDIGVEIKADSPPPFLP